MAWSRAACRHHQLKVAAIGGVASAPLGDSSNPGPFRTLCQNRAASGARVTRSLRGERPARLTCHGSGFATAGVSFRAAIRMIQRRGSRGHVVERWLIRRAVQHANGADAPDGLVRSCHGGARLICNVGRTDKTKLYRTKKPDLAASDHRGHLGMSPPVSGIVRLSSGGARCGVLIDRSWSSRRPGLSRATQPTSDRPASLL